MTAASPITFSTPGGVVTIDPATFEIRRGDEVVTVEPQVYDVLLLLIENRQRVVPKEELLDEVWGDRFVSESALTSRIKSARQAIGDDGRRQESIKTLHGRGYQFTAPVVTADPPAAGEAEGADGAVAPRPDDGGDHERPRATIQPPPKGTIGRDELIAEIRKDLGPGTLTTLVGPAGVGKSHLARHVGAGTDPAWFVPLANVRDPTAVAPAILDAIGSGRPSDLDAALAVVSALRSRSGLLVIDNCEHVLEPVAALVGALRRAGGPLTVLATSRRRLDVDGERVVTVPTLDPDDSLALFAKRLTEHGAELPEGDTGREQVETLCRRLDHLPLALELAGAHVRILGLTHLTELLDQRLELLASTAGPDHHRTLQQAIASSVDSLDGEIAHTLFRFGVFAGPFDLGAAARVAGAGRDLAPVAPIQHLVELAERSLLVVEGTDGARTYRLLESVRLFALARLDASGDADVARRAHLEHFTDAAVDRAARLERRGFAEVLDEVAAGWDNHRAAVDHGLRLGEIGSTVTMVTALVGFAEITQRLEVVSWLDRLLAELGDDDPAGRPIRAGLVRMLVVLDLERATELARGVGDPETDLSAAIARSWIDYLGGRMEDGHRHMAAVDRLADGSKGLTRCWTIGLRAFHEARSGVDPTETDRRMARFAVGTGPVDRSFLDYSRASVEVFRGANADAIRTTERLIETAGAARLDALVIAAMRLRSVALAGHDDLAMVAGRLLDAVRRYRRAELWLSLASDTPMVARVLAASGRPEAALTALGGYGALADAAVGGWSTSFAEALRERLLAAHPEAAGRVEVGAGWEPSELGRFLAAELEDIVAEGPVEGHVDGHAEGP